MGYSNTWNEPFLPWVESENDRRFKRILVISLVVFSLLGAIIGVLPKPQVEQRELKDVSPRLAKLIIEKKKRPPPPIPKAKTKKKVDKKKPVKKKTAKAKKKTQSARKKAQRSGLLAMSDELADLRDTFDLGKVKSNKPLQKVGKAENTRSNSPVLTARAGKSSGGINSRSFSRSTGGGDLTGRKTTAVKGNNWSKGNSRTSSGKGRSGGRSKEEIALVFDKNQGAIYSLYNRVLRTDPSLQGKVVFELTIAPSGKVTKVRILSSDLNNPVLERKLKLRIKSFRFRAKKVRTFKVTFPIEFFPA